jgi:hypothetical protein
VAGAEKQAGEESPGGEHPAVGCGSRRRGGCSGWLCRRWRWGRGSARRKEGSAAQRHNKAVPLAAAAWAAVAQAPGPSTWLELLVRRGHSCRAHPSCVAGKGCQPGVLAPCLGAGSGEVFDRLSFSRCVNQVHALPMHIELSIVRLHRHGVVDFILDCRARGYPPSAPRLRGPGGGVGFR